MRIIRAVLCCAPAGEGHIAPAIGALTLRNAYCAFHLSRNPSLTAFLTGLRKKSITRRSPMALLAGGEGRLLEPLPAKEQWEARNALLRRAVPPTLADFS